MRYDLTYNERGQTVGVQPVGNLMATEQRYAETGQGHRTQSGDTSYVHSLLGVSTANRSGSQLPGDPVAQGTTRYVRTPSGQLISQIAPSGVAEYFISDGHPGSVVALARPDRVGTSDPVVVGRFRYDPYGNQVSKTGSSDTPWRFAGAYYDRFRGLSEGGLYKMGERYYDPQTGRWTQADPVDQSTDLRQGDKYMYAAADPVNVADPSGMFGISDVANAVGLGASVASLGCGLAFTGVGAAACAAGLAATSFISGAVAAGGATSSVDQVAGMAGGGFSALEGACAAGSIVAMKISPGLSARAGQTCMSVTGGAGSVAQGAGLAF